MDHLLFFGHLLNLFSFSAKLLGKVFNLFVGLREANGLLNLIGGTRLTIFTDFENLIAQGLDKSDFYGKINQCFTRMRINFQICRIHLDHFDSQIKVPKNVNL